ncbi:MAG: hypothetical protein ACRDRU_12230 [Pseudonocardiaceae bacterium]
MLDKRSLHPDGARYRAAPGGAGPVTARRVRAGLVLRQPRGPGDCLGFACRLSQSAVARNAVQVEVAFHGRRRL